MKIKVVKKRVEEKKIINKKGYQTENLRIKDQVFPIESER